MIETVWSAQPKIFPVGPFVERLPTCGLEKQGDDSGMRMEIMKRAQTHGLRRQRCGHATCMLRIIQKVPRLVGVSKGEGKGDEAQELVS